MNTKDTKDTKQRKKTCPLCRRGGDHHTCFNGIAPGGSGSELGSTFPLTGGRSWYMKSHFHRSDGLDACSQLRASTGRLNRSVVNPCRAGVSAKRLPMS